MTAMTAPTPESTFFVVEYIPGRALGSRASWVGRKIRNAHRQV